jgi:hypothetical protein
MATKKRRLNPFMEFMAKFRLENKGKGWSVVEMAKEGGKEWRGRNGTVRKGKKTRGGETREGIEKEIADLKEKISQMNPGDEELTDANSELKTLENKLSNYEDSEAPEETVVSQTKDAAEDAAKNIASQTKDAAEDAAKNIASQAKNAFGSLFSNGGRRHRKRRGGFAEYNTGGKRRTKSRRR